MSKAIVKAAIHEALTEAGYDHLIDAEARVIDTVASKMGERLEAAASAAIEEARRAGFDPHDAAAVLVIVGLMEFDEARVAADRTRAQCVYEEASRIEPWPGKEYAGTSLGEFPEGTYADRVIAWPDVPAVHHTPPADGAVSTTSTRPPAPKKKGVIARILGL